MQFKCSVGTNWGCMFLYTVSYSIWSNSWLKINKERKRKDNFSVKPDCHTYYFCHVSTKGMKTLARLSAPHFAGLIKRAGGNLVSKFQKDKIKQRKCHLWGERPLWKAKYLQQCSQLLWKFCWNSSLPIGVVEGDSKHHVCVTLQPVQLCAWGCVPNSACPVVAPRYKPAGR